jgi:phosphoglycolate phosphatase-like HAD superfamily hydrolase
MKLAVFDIDGTLIQPYHAEDAAFLEGLELALDFAEVSSDWTGYPHVTDTGIVTSLCMERLGREPTSDEMSRFRDQFHAAFTRRTRPGDGAEVPGAIEFVASLRSSADWVVAVATGNSERFAVLKLTRAGLPCLDVPRATSDDAISRADLVRLAIGQAQRYYGVERFEHVVSIGGAPWDLKTARELDLPFVAVGPRCGSASTGRGAIRDFSKHLWRFRPCRKPCAGRGESSCP